MTITSVTLPAASLRWRLDGPAGAGMDTLVATLIGAGVTVEAIAPGTAYRLQGPALTLGALADELAGIDGYSLGHELPPEAGRIALSSERAPAFPYVRSVTVHGIGSATSWVARAIDMRLQVATVGISRWSVTGRTADLIAWLSTVWEKPADAVCESLGIASEQAAAEDAPPASVSVSLPTRKTVSEITRDEAGGITQVVQLETSI